MPANGSPAPKTASWAGTPIVASALRGALKDSDPAIRKIGIDWVHSAHDTNAAAALADLYEQEKNPALRGAILRDIAATPSVEGRKIITSVLHDAHASTELLLAAIESAGKMSSSEWNADLLHLAKNTTDDRRLLALFDAFAAKKLNDSIPLVAAGLTNTNQALSQKAVASLQQIGGPSAIDALTRCLDGSNAPLCREAIAALGNMKAKSAVRALLKCAAAPGTQEAATISLTQMPDTAALDIYLDGLASKNASLRGQCESAVRAIHQPALPLIEARLATNNLASQAVSILKQIYENDAAAKKSPIFKHKILEIPIAQYQEFALAHNGDPRRGHNLFHDLKGVACVRCHTIEGVGAIIGPDLTGIHSKYPRSFIIESVLYPSKVILDGYQQVLFETKDDEDVSGIVRNENDEEVTVIDSGGVTHVLKKSNITRRRVSQISLMPEGLQTGLSLTEFADLISYVENPKLPQPGQPSGFASRRGAPPGPTSPNAAPVSPPLPGAELFSFLDIDADAMPALPVNATLPAAAPPSFTPPLPPRPRPQPQPVPPPPMPLPLPSAPPLPSALRLPTPPMPPVPTNMIEDNTNLPLPLPPMPLGWVPPRPSTNRTHP
jgi:putative heme-binding domain-containing protein